MLRLALAAALLAGPQLTGVDAASAGPLAGTPTARAAATQPPADEPPLDELYAIAVEKVVGAARDEPLYLLPTAAAADGLSPRVRRATGPAHAVTMTVARRVAARLERRGAVTVRGVRAALADDDALQLVLGELRYEPAAGPRFGRLRIRVVGTGGERQTVEVLLARGPAAWQPLNVRVLTQ